MINRHALSRLALIVALTAASSACASMDQAASKGSDGAAYMAAHRRALTLDTHLDTPANLVSPRGFDITKRYDTDREGYQVDLPRMNEGGLDGGFWAIYTAQGPLTPEAYARARDTALLRSAAIREMAARHADAFALALRADDAARIDADGRKVVFQSIENSYPLGEDISMVETFYKLGVRMIGPVHNGNNQFADSTNDSSGPRWNGLSPLGAQLVKEANRLGMVLDGSHASDVAIAQMIDMSATPIILSHHGADGPFQHPRNAPDELLKKLAAKGGVIQMNALGSFIKPLQQSPERVAALSALRDRWGAIDDLPADKYDAYLDERLAIDARYPETRAEFSDYMDQFLYTLKLIGPEHVGVGADWDGGGGVNGMRDVSQLPRITERLLAEGYSEADLKNIWGGNVLRLLRAAETHAAAVASR